MNAKGGEDNYEKLLVAFIAKVKVQMALQKMKSLINVFIFVALACYMIGDSFALDINTIKESGLTEKQAIAVLRLALNDSTYRRALRQPGATIEGDFVTPDGTEPLPGYYVLRLVHDTPKSFSAIHLGTFAVGKLTADVWSLAAPTGCKNFHLPALTKLQQAVMRKTKAGIPPEKPLRAQFDCDS